MAKYDFNIIVVGGGTAGLISAYVANTLGGKVALIEADKMGGDCLHRGCVPSKSLIASAHAAHTATNSSRLGVTSKRIDVDYGQIHKRIHGVIDNIQQNDSVERYEKLGITVIQGRAEWAGPHTVTVGDKTYSTRRIIIATGARPRVLDTPGADQSHVYTSDTLWELKQLPANLVVVGGGPIGCELAQAYAMLGSSVTLLEASERILRFTAPDQSKIISKALGDTGVKIRTNASIKSINPRTVSYISSDTTNELAADGVIMAAGRIPNTEWLKDTPIDLDKRGFVKTNSKLRTNASSVYACGDVTGGAMFTHIAEYEAGYAASNALLPFVARTPSYDAIPWTIFTSPQIASVGPFGNHKQPATSNTITHFPLKELDAGIVSMSVQGGIWVESLKNGTIVSATIIAPDAGSLIGEWSLAVNNKLKLSDVMSTIHPYPTFSQLSDRVAGKWRQERYKDWQQKLLKSILKLNR